MMGKKKGFDPSIPIDAKQPPRKRKKKGKKKQPSKYFGLGSALPRGGSRSIASRTQTRAKGTTSGGLPSLGKKRK
jgi:hypothetical protein